MYHRSGFYHYCHGFGRGFGFGFRFHFPSFWWCEPPFEMRFGPRPFPRREEYLEMLKRYRDDLKKELDEVEREIADLEK